ncbi:MAG: 23S rRNA (guanosine(2251)-2'-O)-methyltransferase RlmB [Actinomycetales bacterium]|nr:23S rRNA (guanosine(2251)-2'-O)-methyltransferase RlmB [Actinomycetales bacterium]
MAKPGRPGASKGKGRKGPQVGTGGHGRRALEGKGPTPKAEDRSWHVAGKRKAAQDRLDAARERHGKGGGSSGGAGARRTPRAKDDTELVTGRNSVLEALRAKIPATALYLAARVEMDDRVKEALALATKRGIPILEVMRPELDRMTGADAVHQGLALKVPPYEYAHPLDLLDAAEESGQVPLLVALDGVTDPRNLGAIVRSAAAFGGHGVIVPQRRSVGMTASAWKTSAGAASRLRVAMAANLARALTDLKQRGVFVVGLDGGGDTALPGLALATSPLVIVVGSEGEGLSRLVAETCDAIVSIPIEAATESLNAGIATGVALYEVAKLRAEG